MHALTIVNFFNIVSPQKEKYPCLLSNTLWASLFLYQSWTVLTNITCNPAKAQNAVASWRDAQRQQSPHDQSGFELSWKQNNWLNICNFSCHVELGLCAQVLAAGAFLRGAGAVSCQFQKVPTAPAQGPAPQPLSSTSGEVAGRKGKCAAQGWEMRWKKCEKESWGERKKWRCWCCRHGAGEGALILVCVSYYPTLALIGNKLS